MSAPRRGIPEAYVTSFTGILAGDAFCRYAAWYRARFWVKNTDPNFDKARWIADHALVLKTREMELRAQGYRCTVENQNTFTLIGKTAKATGKPDILSVRDHVVYDSGSDGIHDRIEKQALVTDVKTGKRLNEHFWQALTYMYALPRVRPDLAGYQFSAELVYKDGIVDIQPSELTRERIVQITDMLREIGFGMPSEKTPSESECERCPLSLKECPEKAAGPRASGSTSDF